MSLVTSAATKNQMNPYRRAALFLIRLIATGFILFTLLQAAAYLAVFLKTGKKPEFTALSIFWQSLSLLIGVVLLGKSNTIAKRLTQDFDE